MYSLQLALKTSALEVISGVQEEAFGAACLVCNYHAADAHARRDAHCYKSCDNICVSATLFILLYGWYSG